jgi:glyceraldehyde 3-phosphate dehydrogenase
LAINGFGRIGRAVFPGGSEEARIFEFVGINDLVPARQPRVPAQVRHRARPLEGDVKAEGESTLIVNGKKIQTVSVKRPRQLPWKTKRRDYVLESTGCSPMSKARRSTSRPAPSG